nr:miraculin-like isoform X1 [Ipomoea trifida]
MKTTPFLSLSLFLFSVLLCESRNAPNPPVLDINGKTLRATTKYYVKPLQEDLGGGLDLAPMGNQTCPQNVVQDNNDWLGQVIQFHPVNSKDGVIRESTDLNIAFPNANTGCPESNVWTIIGDVSWYDDTQYVTVGGEIGNPGERTLVNWFKIVKTTKAYKLRFCPDVCSSCDFVCQDVSVTAEGDRGQNTLASEREREMVMRRRESNKQNGVFIVKIDYYICGNVVYEAQDTNAVLDIRGKILRAGVKYYVVPLLQDQGGGLDLTSTGHQTCPQSVVQDDVYWWGNTIQFYPVNSQKGVIREWIDLNIEFPDAYTGCPESKVWTISGDPSSYDIRHFITDGGRKGNPGQQTLSNWFKIVKTTNAYKFMFCPSVCDDCSYVCQDVGISKKRGQRRLVLSNTPLEINFKKA